MDIEAATLRCDQQLDQHASMTACGQQLPGLTDVMLHRSETTMCCRMGKGNADCFELDHDHGPMHWCALEAKGVTFLK